MACDPGPHSRRRCHDRVAFSPQCEPIALTQDAADRARGRAWPTLKGSQLYAVVEAGRRRARAARRRRWSCRRHRLRADRAGARRALDAAAAKPLVELARRPTLPRWSPATPSSRARLRADGVHCRRRQGPRRRLRAGTRHAWAARHRRRRCRHLAPRRHDAGRGRRRLRGVRRAARTSRTATRPARAATSSSPGGRRSSRCRASPSTSRRRRRPRP